MHYNSFPLETFSLIIPLKDCFPVLPFPRDFIMEAKAQRLFNARAKAESNLAQIHQDTLDAINKGDRRAKVDKLVEKGVSTKPSIKMINF